MEVNTRTLYDVLHYVHCEDCGGKGKPAIISEQSSPRLFNLYTYDQILAACKNLKERKCFGVSIGLYPSICLDPVHEDTCEQVLAELSIQLKK